MDAYEVSVCNDLLRYGDIVRDVTFVCDGINVRQYTIKYDGELYDLTKHNGQWVYFFHYNKRKR